MDLKLCLDATLFVKAEPPMEKTNSCQEYKRYFIEFHI